MLTQNFNCSAQSLNKLTDKIYLIEENFLSKEWFCEMAILAPKTYKVCKLNSRIHDLIPGESMTFKSADTVINHDKSMSYPTEFLNTIKLSGTPLHSLILRVGVSVMLMHNLVASPLYNNSGLHIIPTDSNRPEDSILNSLFTIQCLHHE